MTENRPENNVGGLGDFLKSDVAGGILLCIAAVVAIILANTPLNDFYHLLIEIPVTIQIGAFEIAKPLFLWINDGLMAIFFFLIGLELKREFLVGELSRPSNIVLPGIGAVGGMAAPALIYIMFNRGNEMAMQGWAIPTATDIAFTLGILALLGSRVPSSLRIFVTSLAIFDDVGAIIIIALFYTAKISTLSLIVVAVCLCVLVAMKIKKVEATGMYVFVGIIMWAAMLKSGVHATLSGVLLAMFIPMKSHQYPKYSPLKNMEHNLHGAVALFILPLFAFVNSGITLIGTTTEQFFHGVPIGITLGLFLGKQVGIFGLCWLCIQLGFVKLPKNTNYLSLYGVSILCGVGFTMSLFIGALAFEQTGQQGKMFDERVGIMLGSLLSGIVGYLILRWSLRDRVQSAM